MKADAKYYSKDKNQETSDGKECRPHGKEGNCMQNSDRMRPNGNMSLNSRIILKWILKK
jgi:hypothetical protein